MREAPSGWDVEAGGMKGGKTSTVCFNINGVACNTCKRSTAKSSTVGNTAAIPIQAKSSRECAETLE
jgi:hypothetical protein